MSNIHGVTYGTNAQTSASVKTKTSPPSNIPPPDNPNTNPKDTVILSQKAQTSLGNAGPEEEIKAQTFLSNGDPKSWSSYQFALESEKITVEEYEKLDGLHKAITNWKKHVHEGGRVWDPPQDILTQAKDNKNNLYLLSQDDQKFISRWNKGADAKNAGEAFQGLLEVLSAISKAKVK